MERTENCFLLALRAALRGEKLSADLGLAQDEWARLFALAQIHHVLPMIFDAVRELPELKNDSSMPQLKQSIRHQIFMQIQKTGEFFRVYNDLRAHGITPIIVKGAVCRELYPTPDYRISSDEDLLIPEAQTELCHKLLLEHGLGTTVRENELDTVYEIPYRKPGSHLYIELHRHLFPPESEAYGDFNRFFAEAFDKPSVIEIQNTEVLSLSPTDHLFYLICHAFKHFLHSGFGIRQVCDIIMFAEKYGSEINWIEVLENSRSIRAEYFAAAIFRIGENHLGFDPEQAGLSEEWSKIETDETAMLEDLLSAGIFGNASMSRKHSSNITLDAVVSGKHGKAAKNSIILSLFPSAEKLEGRYPYLKNKRYLLPIAWTQRIITYGKEAKGNKKGNSAAEALKIGCERIELLKKYKIIE